jgi:hypothetical protein
MHLACLSEYHTRPCTDKTLGAHLLSVALKNFPTGREVVPYFSTNVTPPMDSSTLGSMTPAALAFDTGLRSPSPATAGGLFESLMGPALPHFCCCPFKSSRSTESACGCARGSSSHSQACAQGSIRLVLVAGGSAHPVGATASVLGATTRSG